MSADGGPTAPECALAAEMFGHFCAAGTMKQILALHREICNTLNLKPNRLPDFYPNLKAKLASSWKAQALFKKFDLRANHKVYAKGRACAGVRVLIIGAGPCGLRAAIECQLLGAKVVVIEKRDRISRNNVLHLWPFVIHDLRALGAKKFFGKFCAGSIDHISIRQLQSILLKVALLLGVEFHEGVSFEELLEPTVTNNNETLGWRALVSPAEHPVAQFEFDALVGADGKRNTLHGFKRKEFRGKLAMAITANFINRHTEQEASIPEISGVAFIFHQKFFKELYEVTGIDLENIVYYKDDTHYFVMTAKKHSLIDKGVLLNDYSEVSRLLSVENVDRAALMRYAQEAARFSTDARLPLKDFALNHYGEPDVALFDFTSMYAAENASMVYERLGRRLLCQLVGDSLLEPFWPTGSGCARGFLSALDAAWAVRLWGQTPAPHPLAVIAERESIYRLLAQTTSENLQRDLEAYTLEPATRYPNPNKGGVTPRQVTSFYDSDDPLPLDPSATATNRKRRRDGEVSEQALLVWMGCGEGGGVRAAAAPGPLATLLRRYRPDLLPERAPPAAVYHVLHHHFGITPLSTSDSLHDVPEAKVRAYLQRVHAAFKGEVPHVHHHSEVFEQIKRSQQEKKHSRDTTEHTVAMYASAAAENDKSHSSYRKKRRSFRPQVSTDPSEFIRKKIGKLDLNDISKLARLIKGHDTARDNNHTDKHKELQEQIISLLDPDESPEHRNSLIQLLQGTTRIKLNPKELEEQVKLSHFFQQFNDKPVKPPRRLKGLDPSSIKVTDFSDLNNVSTFVDDVPQVPVTKPPRRLKGLDPSTVKKSRVPVPKLSDIEQEELNTHKHTEHRNIDRNKFKRASSHDFSDNRTLSITDISGKEMGKAVSYDSLKRPPCVPKPSTSSTSIKSRSYSFDGSSALNSPKLSRSCRSSSIENSDITESTGTALNGRPSKMLSDKRTKHSSDPQLLASQGRSKSVGRTDMEKTRSVTDICDGNKRQYTPCPKEHSVAARAHRMAEIIDGGRRHSTPTRAQLTDTIGASELKLRKQRVTDIIHGRNQRPAREPQHNEHRKNSGEMLAFRAQRVSDMINKPGAKRAKGERNKGPRVILKQRFEKSIQMLSMEPQEVAPSHDLHHDYNLQQYRADAPEFGERIRKLEKKLQHYEEGRIVGAGSRAAGGGERVARLAAELAGTSATYTHATTKANKPKDLMRSVGKIERDDWNVKEIERKIKENRLGRPEPRSAERVPKWDREQFLGRQRRLKEGENEEKWGEIDETLHKLDQKLRDSGRPDHGTKKVANLATKFVKKDETQTDRANPKEECKRGWRTPAATGLQCAACNTRVFAAEGVAADGLHLHRACFRCAVCKTVLRPGNYTMAATNCGSRLVCLRHTGSHVPDAAAAPVVPAAARRRAAAPAPPERISVELSDAREIDEDEWTDRNFLASETSGQGGLSDNEESSSEEYEGAADSAGSGARTPLAAPPPAPRLPHHYFSDDSFGYDDYSDDGAESSGNESCSRMREAREARRREVPADNRPPTDSSEVESEDMSDSSDDTSSGTEMSTDSEFAQEECVPCAPPSPPAILVTAPPPAPPHSPPPPRHDYPLSRTLSAGGLATKRALELKRKYLLGEPSPPAVRKSDSTSQLDTKLEAFRSHITEFQKMLHPAPTANAAKPVVTFQLATEPRRPQPMPDILKNLVADAPLDLLTKVDLPLYRKELTRDVKEDNDQIDEEIESDSLTDLSHTDTPPKPVPRVEVHDEGGELIQLDSLTIVKSGEESRALPAGGGVAAESDTSESCRDATTLALNDTELSDCVAEASMLDDSNIDQRIDNNFRNTRALKQPQTIPNAPFTEFSNHVCGRTTPAENIVYSNALEHFEFVDEGDQDPSIESPLTPRNEGYMELVDHDYDSYSPGMDRSMNFIERSFSETVIMDPNTDFITCHFVSGLKEDSNKPNEALPLNDKLETSPIDKDIEVKKTPVVNHNNNESSNNSTLSDIASLNASVDDTLKDKLDTLTFSEITPLQSEYSKNRPDLSKTTDLTPSYDNSPPLAETPSTPKAKPLSDAFSTPFALSLYSPAICRSASQNMTRSSSGTESGDMSVVLSSGSLSPVSPLSPHETTERVQEIKRERDEQTAVVRRLVLQRLGGGGREQRTGRRERVAPRAAVPPPVPPLPPPTPAPPLAPPLPVTPSFSDPELARERRRKSIMKSISNYLNRRLGPRHKCHSEPDLTAHEPLREPCARSPHKSTSLGPPVPPPPANYRPPSDNPDDAANVCFTKARQAYLRESHQKLRE